MTSGILQKSVAILQLSQLSCMVSFNFSIRSNQVWSTSFHSLLLTNTLDREHGVEPPYEAGKCTASVKNFPGLKYVAFWCCMTAY